MLLRRYTRAPTTATEPKTPKAFPRSRGSRKVLTSVPQGGRCEEGAERALQRPGRNQHPERAGADADGRGDSESGSVH
jgi:hypothetical protein